MERPLVSSLWFPFLLITVLSSTTAQNEPVYTAVNGIISLKPETSGPFTNILWKHEGNLVVEWVGGQLDYYGKFKGPATLDKDTGVLVIKNTDASFAGLYEVETNSQVQAKGYDVKFIKEVTKPVVVVRILNCSHETKDCRLVCLHYDTPAFGPLTYSWREDDGAWIPGDREMPIVNDEKTRGVKTFSCQVKNPISAAESDAYYNPFYYPILDKLVCSTALYVALKVLVVMTFLGLSGYFMWRKREIVRKRMCPRQDRERTVKYEGPCTVYVL